MHIGFPFLDGIAKNVVQTAEIGAVAVLTTVLGLLVEYVKGKGPGARKVKAYDDADKHLVFLEKWVQISERATPELSPEIRSQISEELQKVRDRLTVELEIAHIAAAHARHAVAAPPTQPLWRRALLFYKPRHAIAWLPRTFFYFAASVSCLGVIIGVVAAGSDGSYWGGFSVVFFFTFIFWLISRAVE